MTSVNVLPNPSIINANVWMENDSYRREKLLEITSYVIEKHVDLATEFSESERLKGSVYTYACEALTLGLLLQ